MFLLSWSKLIFISVLFGYVNVNGLLFAEIKSDQLIYTPMMTAEKLTEFFTVEIISMLSRQTLLKVYLYDHVKCGKKWLLNKLFIFGELFHWYITVSSIYYKQSQLCIKVAQNPLSLSEFLTLLCNLLWDLHSWNKKQETQMK